MYKLTVLVQNIFYTGCIKMLSIKLAEEIVKQTMTRLHHNINVIDTDGVILASGEKERIDSIHEGAIEVVNTGKVLHIDEQKATEYNNCKPGINLPIYFNEKIIGVIGITGNPDALQEIANLVQLTTEMMVHQVLMEGKSEWQRKNGDFIFKALINNEKIDPALKERMQKLPFTLKGPFQIILLQPLLDTPSNQLSLQLENILYRQQALYGQTAFNEYYIFICGSTVTDMNLLVQKLQQLPAKFQSYFGISASVETLSQLPFAFNGAKTALHMSTKIRPVTYFDQIEIHTLFKQPHSLEVKNFIQRMPLLSEKLSQTLQTFFAYNLQLNACAEALEIHRHTLTYRLQKITSLTGYNPQHFEDAFILKLMLLLQETPK